MVPSLLGGANLLYKATRLLRVINCTDFQMKSFVLPLIFSNFLATIFIHQLAELMNSSKWMCEFVKEFAPPVHN